MPGLTDSAPVTQRFEVIRELGGSGSSTQVLTWETVHNIMGSTSDQDRYPIRGKLARDPDDPGAGLFVKADESTSLLEAVSEAGILQAGYLRLDGDTRRVFLRSTNALSQTKLVLHERIFAEAPTSMEDGPAPYARFATAAWTLNDQHMPADSLNNSVVLQRGHDGAVSAKCVLATNLKRKVSINSVETELNFNVEISVFARDMDCGPDLMKTVLEADGSDASNGSEGQVVARIPAFLPQSGITRTESEVSEEE